MTAVGHDEGFEMKISRSRFIACGVGVLFGSVSIVKAQTTAPTVEEIAAERVIEIPSSKRTGEPPVVTALAISPDGKMIATGGDDGIVRLWDRETVELKNELRAHTDWVRVARFEPNGKWLTTAGDDRQVRLWNIETSEGYALHSGRASTYCMAISADGKKLIEAGFDDKIRIHDLVERKLLKEFEAPSADIRAIVTSPTVTTVAAAGRNGKIRVWRGEDLTAGGDLVAHRQRVRALAISPNNKLLISGGDDRQLIVWDLDAGTEVFRLPMRPAKTQALVFCGDRLVASGGSDNVIRIWDLDLKTEVAKLVGHTGSVSMLEYHPTTTDLVSASFDTSVRIWKLMSNEKLKLARQHAADATQPASTR